MLSQQQLVRRIRHTAGHTAFTVALGKEEADKRRQELDEWLGTAPSVPALRQCLSSMLRAKDTYDREHCSYRNPPVGDEEGLRCLNERSDRSDRCELHA